MGRLVKRDKRPDFFAQGGSGHMFDRGTAHASVSGQSGKDANGGASGQKAERHGEGSYGKDVRYAEGGSNHMFGKGHAGKMTPFVSGKQSQEG